MSLWVRTSDRKNCGNRSFRQPKLKFDFNTYMLIHALNPEVWFINYEEFNLLLTDFSDYTLLSHSLKLPKDLEVKLPQE